MSVYTMKNMSFTHSKHISFPHSYYKKGEQLYFVFEDYTPN